ncbi:MAG: aldo/keto reductase [Anaerolineae bacterium]
MNYRTHGGLTVSAVGVGCYGLGGAYGPPDVARYAKTLRRAYELGVTFFDTAHTYGDAERILGEVIGPFRDEVVISTKIAVREGARPSLARADIVTSCEESLRRLGIDRIDLYQVHFDDPQTPVADVVETLEALRDEGKIRRYGIGHLSPGRAEKFLAQGDVFSVMMELSPVARISQQTLLPVCQRYDAAAIAFSVTGRGLLTGRYSPGERPTFAPGDIRNLDPLFQRERFASGLRVAGELREIGERHGKTPVQVAIAWVLAQPQVLVALTGPSSVAHLEENLAAGDWPLPEAARVELDDFLAQEEDRLAEAQAASVREILTQPLPKEPAKAFTDLVYAIETSILLGWVEERTVLPVFQHLFGLRDTLDEGGKAALDQVQHRLRDLTPDVLKQS